MRTFLDALERGEPWYPALLDVIARWVTPEEDADGVVYRYLIAGEAFDWLRLAERLIDAAGKAIPAAEAERLLFDGKPPRGYDDSEEAFARAIGHEKHRAHLNFQYGVTVEEVLLLQAELELVKARNLEGPRGSPPDVAAYERVYGRTLAELQVEYRAETGRRAAAAARCSRNCGRSPTGARSFASVCGAGARSPRTHARRWRCSRAWRRSASRARSAGPTATTAR